MSDSLKTPWQLKSKVVGIGSGFNDHTEYIVDADGDEIAMSLSHATELTKYAMPCDMPFFDRYKRPHFRTGKPFPHTAKARLMTAAPALLAACERALSYLTNANAYEPEEVVSAIIDAMVLTGADRAALEECAKATWHPFQSESKGPNR